MITPWKPLPLEVPVTSTTSPAANVSTVISAPTSKPSTFLNSRMKRLGAVLAFATCPLAGLLLNTSRLSSKPTWIALY
ncbi:Uncharacterised protein [Streptococcus pneumoniae]|nr:Uncharacterised protein [Streptococcus pneumoniae]